MSGLASSADVVVVAVGSSDPLAVCSQAGGYCTSGLLAAGASVLMSVRFRWSVAGSYLLQSVALPVGAVDPTLSGGSDNRGAALAVVIREPTADLSVGLSGPATGVEGEDLSYSLVVTNNGPEPSLRFVAGSWNLSSSWAAVSVSVGGTDCGYPGIPYLCQVNGLAVGASVTITLLTRYLGTGPATFTAKVYNNPDYVPTINPDPADPNTSNDLDAVTTVVRARQADLSVGLSGPATGVEGEDLSYSLVVTNNGPEPSVYFVAGAWDIAPEWSDVLASLGGN